MYGKIFSSIYDGSLYGNWKAIVTFQQMIVLCNADGVVDMTPQALAARTSIPLDVIQEGLAVLEAPDQYSRTPDQDGRRIERLDSHRPWGWRLVNYRKYRQMVSAEEKREADRERIAAKRNADKAAKEAAEKAATAATKSDEPRQPATASDIPAKSATRRTVSLPVVNVAQAEAEAEEEEQAAVGDGGVGEGCVAPALELVPAAVNGSPKPKPDRASRIPDDFPAQADIAWARLERPDLVIGTVAAMFRDHWTGKPGKDGRKLDWPATWRNWIRSQRALPKPAAVPAEPAAQRWD